MVSPEDIEKIQAIKLSSQKSVDLLGWHYNKDDIYSVKSGYWLATQLEGQQFNPPYGNVALKRVI